MDERTHYSESTSDDLLDDEEIVYYKATRMDSTSFQDGTTTWTVGAVTSLPKKQRGTDLCEAGLLHASTEPGESLHGGSWPCRLFTVDWVKKAFVDTDYPHTIGAYKWIVTAELPSWQALGPNGEVVVVFIDRLKRLTGDELSRIHVSLTLAQTAAMNEARHAVWTRARAEARYAASEAAWNAAWTTIHDADQNGVPWDDTSVAFIDVCGEAAQALVVRDLITTEQFDALYTPWVNAMEESSLL